MFRLVGTLRLFSIKYFNFTLPCEVITNSIYKTPYTPNLQKSSVSIPKMSSAGMKFSPAFEGDAFILNGNQKFLTKNNSSFFKKLKNSFSSIKEKFFNSQDKKIIEREEGLVNSCLTDTVKEAFINAKTVLENIDCFDADELTQLSEVQKGILRKCIKTPYFLLKRYTVANDANTYIKEAKSLKSQLEERYSEGYSVVSVGSSPSVLCDVLKLENINVKYLPFSRRLGYSYVHHKKDFQKLYKDAGITKDFIINQKNIVFLDYTLSGKGLGLLKSVTENMYNTPKNAHYLNINKDLKLDEEFVELFLKSSNNGSYSFISPMYNRNMMKQYLNKKSIFKPSLASKLMRFALLNKYGKI